MKKNYSLLLTLLLAFSGMMLLTACSDDDEKDPVKPTKSYLEYLKEDYAMVTSRFPNAVGKFVEAQYELNGKVSELAAKDLKVINVTYVYNLGWDEDLG